jgi:hypothetical protein
MTSARSFPERKKNMGMKDKRDWLRIVLAFVAVLLVAGPGLVLAGVPSASYPYATQIVILGPRSVNTGDTASYSVKVTLSDGTSFTVSSPGSGVSMTSDGGTLTGFSLQAPGSPGTVHLMASFDNGHGQTNTGTRGILITSPST